MRWADHHPCRLAAREWFSFLVLGCVYICAAVPAGGCGPAERMVFDMPINQHKHLDVPTRTRFSLGTITMPVTLLVASAARVAHAARLAICHRFLSRRWLAVAPALPFDAVALGCLMVVPFAGDGIY